MRQYTSITTYNIKELGTVIAVRNDERFDKNSNHLIGEQVMIDGIIHTVLAVEAPALGSIREGCEIGLLVARS